MATTLSLCLAPDAVTLAMGQCADGDDPAFRTVYDRVKPRLFAFFSRHLRDRATAEDLAHETLLRIYAARTTFVRRADVWPWAYTIARRLLIDARRRSRTDPLGDSASPDAYLGPVRARSPRDDVQLREMAALVDSELAAMSRSHRSAFEMIRCDGMTVAQTALALGATKTATKVRAHRVFERLRCAVANHNERCNRSCATP